MRKSRIGSSVTVLAVIAGCGSSPSGTAPVGATGAPSADDAGGGVTTLPPATGTDAGTLDAAGSPVATDASTVADAAASCSSTDPIGANGTYMPVGATVACGTRDEFTWPFAKNSVWNMPIGSGATYVDANLGTMGACNVDNDLVYRENGADPSHQDFRPDHQYGVDGAGGTGKLLNIPDTFLYPGGPNNGAAFFDADGHTIYEFSAFAREPAGSDPTGWDFGTNQIQADGTIGGHAGSGMSAVGGTLRPGELTGAGPIRHALKAELDWAVLSANWPGKFRWPARNSDGNGNNNYGGTVQALTMGSLVALRPEVDVHAMTWQTPFGEKIAHAFQDYGAYVVDTTGNYWKWANGGYTMAVCAQNESIDEVKSTYGIDFRSGWGGGGDTWTADMQAIYSRLAVVDNNTPANIGGGGTLRQPLAPDFAPGAPTASDAGVSDAGH